MMTNLFLKAKESNKKIASGQSGDHSGKTTPTKRILTKNISKIPPYLVAVLCATSFYLFEFFPDSSSEYAIDKKEHIEAKKKRAIALKKVKKFAEGSEVYSEYLREKLNANKTWEALKNAKRRDRVFGFTNFKQFIGEFGPMLGLFIYALVNLFRSFYFEHRNIGMKFFHGLIISVTMFYFLWIFQQFQDFSKITYYAMTLLSAAVVVLAIYLITKYQDHYINRLKEKVSRLAAFSFLHIKQEKKSEMLNLFRELSKDP